MQTLTLCDDGLSLLLTLVKGDFANWSIGLSTYGTAPASTDTLATYTGTEASFTGYVEQLLGGWPMGVTLDGNGNMESDNSTVTFTCSVTGAPQTINSFFLYRGTGGVGTLIGGCPLDSPVTISNAGDFVSINLSAFFGALAPPF